jgi:hypothetical protein
VIPPDALDRMSRSSLLGVDEEIVRLDGHLLPGSSGAPLIASDGKVAAIASGGLAGGGAALSWAVPASNLNKLLSSTDPPLSDFEVADLHALLFYKPANLSKYEKSLALILGYESAVTLALFMAGEPTNQIKAKVTEYLSLLGIDDILYPDDPVGINSDGQPVAEYAQRVAGTLSARGTDIGDAFILGWYGVITLNTPDLRPDFDLCEFAQRSGFDKAVEFRCDARNKEQYFNQLVEFARSSEVHSVRSLEIPTYSQKRVALMLGYESAVTLALFMTGEPTNQIRAKISEYLRLLRIDDVQFPNDPVGNSSDGQPAAEYAQEVAGRLSARGTDIGDAFILGWYGVITLNTPDLRPDFDLCEFAQRSGFDKAVEFRCDARNKEQYFNQLVEFARSSEVHSVRSLEIPTYSQKRVALMLGYESAVTLALFMTGEPTNQIRAKISEYLRLLRIDDVQFPNDPVGNSSDGQPAAEYAQEVAGRLSARGTDIGDAFILGWYGVITLNTPDLRPDFDLCEFAQRSGFDDTFELKCDARSKEQYFKQLIERVRNSLAS